MRVLNWSFFVPTNFNVFIFFPELLKYVFYKNVNTTGHLRGDAPASCMSGCLHNSYDANIAIVVYEGANIVHIY